MNLDDRLRTVLDVAGDSDSAARAQYRQLVDLLGSGGAVGDGTLVAAAFLRLSALARRIPATTRAEILSDPALRLRSPALVAQLCEAESEVANAALEAAELDDEGWTLLSGVLGEDLQSKIRKVRTVGRARRDGDRQPLIKTRDKSRTTTPGQLTPPAPVPSRASAQRDGPPPRRLDRRSVSDVSEIVERIERFRIARRDRMTQQVIASEDAAAAPEPVEEEAENAAAASEREVDCIISPDGRIGWTSALSPMLGGLVLSATDGAAAHIGDATATALRRQQAVRSGHVTITASPAVSGVWRLDAAPNFDAVGRFLGHHARLTRVDATPADTRGDEVRQALHELRTPINALQGFSEIIQQQLFGPVPHQYRALAAGIAGETAAILAAMDEVDRLVRLRLGTSRMGAGQADIGALVGSLVTQLAPAMAERRAAFVGDWTNPDVIIPVAEEELERSLWRLLAIVAAATAHGEEVELDLSADHQFARLEIGLPPSLASLDDDALFSTDARDHGDPMAAGLLGRGFALRLIMAEARAAGGSLERYGDRFVLSLPCESHDSLAEAEAAA